MATTPKNTAPHVIIGAAKGLAEANRAFKEDNSVRSASKTLLKPGDVAGEYDISRQLVTTLSPNGRPVLLTMDHLKQFAHVSKQRAAKLKKGVTAQAIIDLSGEMDRAKASNEIRTATPISATGGTVKFMTNASRGSDKLRHYVTVDFMNYLPIVASAIKLDRAGVEMSNSPLRISCDCGRWRYWLAYLATKAGYNSGHLEDAFPKIRNPELKGIACKHILRVVSTIKQSPFMKTHLAQLVERGRSQVVAKRTDVKVADARAAAEAMKRESWRQRAIRTSEQKQAENSKNKERRALANAVKKAPAPKRAAAQSRRANATAQKAAAALAAQFGMTPEAVLALLAAQQKG